MTRSALAAVGAAALLVLTLTGCSFTSETVSVTAEPGTTVSEGGVTITSEEDPAADLTPDEQFLAALDGRLTSVALTGAELIAAGESVCGGLSPASPPRTCTRSTGPQASSTPTTRSSFRPRSPRTAPSTRSSAQSGA